MTKEDKMAVNIKEMNEIARNFVEDVKQVMPVDKAILFGSYAKGYATELSDVDICFFSERLQREAAGGSNNGIAGNGRQVSRCCL